MIESHRLPWLAFQVFVCVGVWETNWKLTQPNQVFVFFPYFLVHWYHKLHRQVILEPGWKDESGDWTICKGLVCYQIFFIWEGCVGVFKLPLLCFSGLIETFNTEWCLVDDCLQSSKRLGFINWWRLTSKAFIHILNVIKTSKKNFKFMKLWPRWYEPWSFQNNT